MNLLVAGATRVDAGKTTFATGLVAHADAVGFKPRAGHDYWFDHDDCRAAIDAGRLYGKDARRLVEAADADGATPEAINPIHRLWRPAPGPGTGLLGRADREFVVDRVGDGFVVNGTVDVPDRVATALSLSDAPAVDSLAAFNEEMADRHLPTLASFAADIAATDRAVVESYSDVARPIREPTPDAVAVVEPGRVRLYDGDRYVRACEVAPGGRSDGLLERRVPSVLDLLDPVATRRLAPLPDDRRSTPTAVADAYGPAYDRLLDLAGS